MILARKACRKKCVTCYRVINCMITARRHVHNCTTFYVSSVVWIPTLLVFTIAFMSTSNNKKTSGRVLVGRVKLKRCKCLPKIIGNINHRAIKKDKFNNASSDAQAKRRESKKFCGLRGGFILCPSIFLFCCAQQFRPGDSKWIIILIDHVIYFICSCTCRWREPGEKKGAWHLNWTISTRVASHNFINFSLVFLRQ